MNAPEWKADWDWKAAAKRIADYASEWMARALAAEAENARLMRIIQETDVDGWARAALDKGAQP